MAKTAKTKVGKKSKAKATVARKPKAARKPSVPSSRTDSKIAPTNEQDLIVKYAEKLETLDGNGKGQLIRIIAGAGTGKTTTLGMLAATLLNKNFRILYIVFNKSAQEEANKRFPSNSNLTIQTMHATALKLVGCDIESISDDYKVREAILEKYRDKIHNWLKSNIKTEKKGEIQVSKIELVSFWIYKTLENFYRSSENLDKLRDSDWLTYYPAKKDHEDKIGFHQIGRFYVDAALEIWNEMQVYNFPFGHDVYLKKAQLLLDPTIPLFDVILLDESQDATGVQIDLFVTQQRSSKTYPKHVFIVGDAVQTIYSFRGAKPKLLTSLKTTKDFKLTESFRFGPNIARIANSFLWMKEFSPQRILFNPYRLIGRRSTDGEIMENKAKPEYPYTVIGRGNVTLMVRAILILENDPNAKIAINGSIESFTKTVAESYEMFKFQSTGKCSLPKFTKHGSFETFVQYSQDMEQSQDLILIGLSKKYEDQLPVKMKMFETLVIHKQWSLEDANVILTTTHQAKGLEWDSVVVENDFIQLKISPRKSKEDDEFRPASQLKEKCDFEFNLKPFGDDLNLWYVAVTRPMKRLFLPQFYWDLIDFMENVQNDVPILKEDQKTQYSENELTALKAFFKTGPLLRKGL